MTELQHHTDTAPVEGPAERPPLEVALLTWEYPPIPSAKGRVACEVAHGLAAYGANVRVFTMDRAGRVQTGHERIEVIGCADRVTGLRRFMRRVPGLDHLAAAAAFRERVHEEHARRPFDIIEATSHRAPAAMLMDCGLPVVIRSATPYALEAAEQHGLASRISSSAASGLEARCVEKCDAVISNSRAHAGMIKDWYGIKPGHLHLVTPLSVSPELARRGRRSPYPPAHARLRLARIGGVSVRSGFADTLLGFDTVLRELSGRGEPLPELHLIGLPEGALDTALPELDLDEATPGQVFDHGRLPDHAMAHVLGRCHFVLAASRYQSTGSVYHEAACFGRPLIACAEDPAARDFIQRHECGRLVQNCASDEIAQAVLGLFEDRDAQLAYRHSGLKQAETWSRPELGARTIQAYRRAMNLEAIDLPALQPASGTRLPNGRLA